MLGLIRERMLLRAYPMHGGVCATVLYLFYWQSLSNYMSLVILRVVMKICDEQDHGTSCLLSPSPRLVSLVRDDDQVCSIISPVHERISLALWLGQPHSPSHPPQCN